MGEPIEQGSLTGRRRFVADDDGYGVLSLQVEVNTWSDGDKSYAGSWTTKWRWAKRDDITSAENVINLEDIERNDT